MIITSRLNKDQLKDQISSQSPQKHINLGIFSLDEGVEFLKKKSERADIQMNTAQMIVKEVDGHPLCLDQIANYIRISDCDIKKYLDFLREDTIDVIDRKPASDAATPVDISRLKITKIVKKNMDSFGDGSPSLRKVLHVLAFFDPTGIPVEVLNQGKPELSDKKMGKNLRDSDYIKSELLKHCLFSCPVTGQMKVHRIIQTIIKEEVLNTNCLQETLRNCEKMLVCSVEEIRKLDSQKLFLLYRNFCFFQGAVKCYKQEEYEWIENFQESLEKDIETSFGGQILGDNTFIRFTDGPIRFNWSDITDMLIAQQSSGLEGLFNHFLQEPEEL